MSTEVFFLPFHSFCSIWSYCLRQGTLAVTSFCPAPHPLMSFCGFFVSYRLHVYLLESLLLLSSPFVTFLLFLLQNFLFPFLLYSFFCLIAYLLYYLLHSLMDFLDWVLLSTEYFSSLFLNECFSILHAWFWVTITLPPQIQLLSVWGGRGLCITICYNVCVCSIGGSWKIDIMFHSRGGCSLVVGHKACIQWGHEVV